MSTDWLSPLLMLSLARTKADVLTRMDRMWLQKPVQDARVTSVTSANNVDVNGVPRHILDIRKLYSDGKDEDFKAEKDAARVVEFGSDSSDNDDLGDEGCDVEAEQVLGECIVVSHHRDYLIMNGKLVICRSRG